MNKFKDWNIFFFKFKNKYQTYFKSFELKPQELILTFKIYWTAAKSCFLHTTCTDECRKIPSKIWISLSDPNLFSGLQACAGITPVIVFTRSTKEGKILKNSFSHYKIFEKNVICYTYLISWHRKMDKQCAYGIFSKYIII